MENDNKTLQLFDIKVIFADLEDRGFGLNIVIDATDPAVQAKISEWVKANNINGGEAKFKDYTTKEGEATKQYTFKLSKFTEFGGADNLNEKSLGYGAIINLLPLPTTMITNSAKVLLPRYVLSMLRLAQSKAHSLALQSK